MIKYLKRLFQRSKPDALVQSLRANCAHLMLERDECVFFNPMPGMFGPVVMYGSTNPTFEFQAFNYARKEYMNVRVEVSTPNRIQFYSTTADEGFDAKTDKAHEKLALQFFTLISNYFPLMGAHRTKRTTSETKENKDARPSENV